MSPRVEPIDEVRRSAKLLERLLADPELRRRFRADAASVLHEYGLPALAGGLEPGRRALMTLELRESRSSLAGAMAAAAAESVDLAHVAERALPSLAHDAGHAVHRLVQSLTHHARHAPTAKATRVAKPELRAAAIPALAPRPSVEVAAPAGQVAPAPTAPAGPVDAPAAPSATPSGGAAVPSVEAASYGRTPAATVAEPRSTHRPGTVESAEPVAPEPAAATTIPYPGDDATPQQIAAWMGATAARAGLPAELPVMAALTESGLHNLNYGDRDSVGFFQMRLSVWDTGQYAGYPTNPSLQLEWFINHALAVKAESPGLSASANAWGQWIADVERPADAYRSRYQLQLAAARQLLAGTGLEPAVHAAAAPVAQAASASVGDEALGVAMRYLGTPYQWGGSSPATGFDCSGLVQYAYAQEGVQLPRVAADQFDVGTPVPRRDLEPGDAVFFEDPDGYVHHVGLYIGGGRFINAPQTGEDVKISSLSEPYFAEQYAGARRYAPASLGDPRSYARTLPTVGGPPGTPR